MTDSVLSRQLDFDWHLPRTPEFVGGEPTTEERWSAFHELNPHVYFALRQMALDLVERGRQRIGIRMLWEILRWKTMMLTPVEGDGFKLNDHYTRFYARELMANEPKLKGVFELRERRV